MYHRPKRVYPSQVRIDAGGGGLRQASVAMAEQVRAIDKRRLGEFWRTLNEETLGQLDTALLIALHLPGQA